MLKVIVRKFETESEAVLEYLENLGFEGIECIDAESDSLGGLIETQIADESNLSSDVIYEIISDLQAVCPACLVQWERYELTAQGSSDRAATIR